MSADSYDFANAYCWLKVQPHTSADFVHVPIESLAKLLDKADELERLAREVMEWHREPSNSEYNECEDSPCHWCANAMEALGIQETPNKGCTP